ncbi:unnamed protein product [Lupinus luteus]|uniref:Pentatricopeptide repeat-containing protein n=1 Tax=Lupinus luteus TaxID=3873 RepID=A0AAV1XAC8_LUPLU
MEQTLIPNKSRLPLSLFPHNSTHFECHTSTRSCIDKDCITVGRELHARIGLVGKVDPFVETKLVSMYAKCGHLGEVWKVFFDEMRERNLFTWSAMIGACCRDRCWEEAVDLFYDMMRDGVSPDEFLMPKIVQACGKCRDLETVELIHSVQKSVWRKDIVIPSYELWS